MSSCVATFTSAFDASQVPLATSHRITALEITLCLPSSWGLGALGSLVGCGGSRMAPVAVEGTLGGALVLFLECA